MDSGFVAGTLVHTDKGLVPIEQIKVGDLVLSKDQSGDGETKYKPVLALFNSSDAVILMLSYYCISNPMSNIQSRSLYLTEGHLFWVVKDDDDCTVNQWQHVSDIEPASQVMFADGSLVWVDGYREVLRTDNPNVGYVYDLMDEFPELLVDLSEHKITTYCLDDYAKTRSIYSEETLVADYDSEIVKEYLAFFEIQSKPDVSRATVYDLDVADFHTYYVGKLGVWVHSVITS